MASDLKLQRLQNTIDHLTNKVDHALNTINDQAKPLSEKANKPKWESLINTFSIAAIPVVIACGGWFLQKTLQDQSIKRDYVQLAVSILKESDTSSANLAIRNWAVQLLNENSPVKLSDKVQDQLKSGEISLPTSGPDPARYSGSARPLDSLKPEVAELAKKLIIKAKEEGIEVIVIRTYTSPKEQEQFYAQGRTKPGRIITNARTTAHTRGLAFDIMPYRDGHVVTEDDDPTYRKLGEIGRSLGLTWGGDNKIFKDYPHFELKVPE